MSSPSRLAVLLFTDIVGSTDVKSRVGVGEYAPLLERHNGLFESACREFHGDVLKHTGDGYFAAFNTPSEAVRAALRFQQSVRAEPFAYPMTVRIGIHTGEVATVEMAGRPDVIGVAADIASRVMSLAAGGQILLTRSPFNDARQFVNDPGLRWMAHGPYLFKGIEEPVEVFEVGADGLAPLAAPPDSDKARRVVPHDQEPTLGWRPAIGLEIPGRAGWMLERKLGEGGFGEVWLGHHDRTKQRRVFKFCFDADRLRSFKRELTLFRLLRDALGDRRDIARLYEVKLDEPPFFLESEYTDGGNLIEWAERQGELKAVALQQRLDIMAQIADATAAAHSVGILHKDIKPSNVLIESRPDGSVQTRLSDFGIGFIADRSHLLAHQITETGFTVVTNENDSSRTGTRLYAPPELLAGKPFTTQGDVYALGVMLYQIVIGDLQRPLAPGWERGVEDEVLREDVAACIDGDPSRRLPSAAELALRIRSFETRRAQRDRERTERVTKEQQQRQSARRRRLLIGSSSAAGALLTIAGLLTIGLFREHRLRTTAVKAEATAKQQRQAAQESAREAKVRFASARLSHADALAAVARWVAARPIYYDARSVLSQLNEPTFAADLGLMRSYARCLPPVLTCPLESWPMETWLSSDGRMVKAVAGTKLCTVSLPEGKLSVLALPSAEIFAAAFSKDGSRLAYVPVVERRIGRSAFRTRQTVALCDTTTGKQIAEWPAAEVSAILFHPDGRSLVLETADRSVAAATRWCDASTGKTLKSFEFGRVPLPLLVDSMTAQTGSAELASIWKGASSSDERGSWSIKTCSSMGHQLVQRDADLHIARPGNSSEIALMDSRGYCSAASFSPDAEIVAACFSDTLRLWNTSSPILWRRFEAKGDGPVAVSRDLVAARHGRGIAVWPIRGPSDEVSLAGVEARGLFAFSPEGLVLLGEIENLAPAVWDAATGKMLATAGNAITFFHQGVFLKDGDVALLDRRPDSEELRLWNLDSNRIGRRFPIAGEVMALEVRPDAHNVVVLHRPHYEGIPQTEDGELIPAHPYCSEFDVNTGAQRNFRLPITLIQSGLTPDGSIAVSYNIDMQWASRCDTQTGQIVKFAVSGPKANHGSFTHLEVDNAARRAMFVHDQGVSMIDLNKGCVAWTANQNGEGFRSAVFCSGDRMIAATRDDGSVTIINAATGEPVSEIAADEGNAVWVRFSPDGRMMAIGGKKKVSIYDLGRTQKYDDFVTRIEAMRARDPDVATAQSQALLGEWYAFRGMDQWAIEMLERARAGGADVSLLELARCYWRSNHNVEAKREFEAALAHKQAPEWYLRMCIRAINAPASVAPTSAEPNAPRPSPRPRVLTTTTTSPASK